jgi:solute carrier family 6 (neurotransmitter transporter)
MFPFHFAESDHSYKFLVRKPPENIPVAPSNYGNVYTSFLMGVRIEKPEIGHNPDHHFNTMSGYQALRLATELFPATMALLGTQGLSPFWTVLFYFTFILFGLAQQVGVKASIVNLKLSIVHL